jgi:hypothetical protein
MSDHWLPILAAVLGLVGGVAGAAVGGYVANQGQEQRFEEERATRLRELRIDTYVRYLRAVQSERSNAPQVADAILLTADAEVALVARTARLRQAATTLTQSTLYYDTGQESEHARARDRFIELAHAEIEATG